jgi:hypothetical protein
MNSQPTRRNTCSRNVAGTMFDSRKKQSPKMTQPTGIQWVATIGPVGLEPTTNGL